ncbi:MAG: outer membrane beta-barrel protein [Ignavibacteria bacterium]
MKKLFLFLIFIFVSIASLTHSQTRVGFSGEFSSTEFGGTPPDSGSYQSVAGYGGNALVEFNLAKNFYLSIQPGFQKRGSEIKFGDEENLINDTTIIFNISQYCFTLPINVKLYNNRFYVGGGMIFNIMTSANVKNETGSAERDITDYFLNFDVMADFNFGYEFKIGKPLLFIEFRYSQGLININKNESFSQEDIFRSNYKSSGIGFNAGLLFPL